MIPSFDMPYLDLGFRELPAFGLLVATAILVGIAVGCWRSHRLGISVDVFTSYVMWILVSAFLCAHLFDRIAYHPRLVLDDPMVLLRLNEGISSFGGFGGAILGAWLYTRVLERKGIDDGWPWFDATAFCFPFGWVFGRLGCFVAFDHPGVPTRFFLGHADHEGIVRHNLGLYEALWVAVIGVVFVVLARKPRPTGFYLGMLAVLYAPVRFGLDSLRVVDVRYLGLTPGQWGSLVLLGVGLWTLRRSSGRPAL